jgi:uncharacterized protein YbjT (DUF2867 family)
MFAVTAATGQVGRAVASRLVSVGEPVRAITHDPDKASTTSELAGTQVRAVQYGSRNFDDAFDGVSTVLLIPFTDPTWPTIEKQVLAACEQAGVRKIVRLSLIGATPDASAMTLRNHAAGEDLLRGSAVPSSVLRANSFMQNFTNYYATEIKNQGMFHQCLGDAALAMVDVRDLADVAVRLLRADDITTEVVEATGPEPLTYTAAATILSAELGSTIAYADCTPDDYASLLRNGGWPEWAAEEMAALYGDGPFSRGDLAAPTDAVHSILGRPPTTFAQFVRDHRDLFGS